MLPLLLLFGFAPRDPALPSGPPPEHLGRDPAAQWRLSRQPAWLDFQAQWPGDWYVRWDERDGTPRFLGAPGVDEALAAALVEDVVRLAGADPDEFTLTKVTAHDERRILRWTRAWQGAEVVDDQIAVVVQRGRIGGVWVRITPLHLASSPRPGERVLNLDGRAILASQRQDGPITTWRDRAGRVIQRYDQRRFADINISCEERTVGDAFITAPARLVTVTDSAGASEVTDDDGACSLSGDLGVSLTGPELQVTDAETLVTASGTDDITLTGGVDLSKAAASVQHHTHVVRDWVGERWPTLSWLSDQVLADVNQWPYACNAYYWDGSINFYAPELICNNAGQIADVIYHEFGHGIHEHILAAGSWAADISEGSSDYIAATITDDAYVAPEFFPGSPYLRELDTDKVYPDDVIGEEHNDGLIWASFLWNLREQWVDAYGETDGVSMTDLLFLGALEQGPQLTDATEAVLLADDDDGDWSNGTPHDCELLELLDHHGLGPGALGAWMLEDDPLGPQASATDGYPLTVSLYSLSADCAAGDSPSLSVWYTDDESLSPPRGDDAPTGWAELSLSASGDSYLGLIPREPANTRVRWFVRVVSADGSETTNSYDDIAENVASFWVGDREEAWCDDLEGDTSGWSSAAGSPEDGGVDATWTDTWVFDSPAGARWKPDAAASGSIAAMTGLDGTYPADDTQTLTSPSVTVPVGMMRLLSYQRWLTVEDGLYDHARIYLIHADGAARELWSNPATDAGTTPLLDTDWVTHDLDLTPSLTDAETVQLAWTLSSDPGLQYGGWAIDDVCLVQLADVPGHYRVDDLRGTRADGVATLSWSVPWIRPITGAVLVRKAGAWPSGPDDGEVLESVTDPVWGEVHSAVDPVEIPGEPIYYAVFTSGGPDDWYTEVVEGENGLVLGGLGPTIPHTDSDEPVDSADTGTPDSAGEGEGEDEGEGETGGTKPTGCGCASAPGADDGLIALASLLALVGIRRRPRR